MKRTFEESCKDAIDRYFGPCVVRLPVTFRIDEPRPRRDASGSYTHTLEFVMINETGRHAIASTIVLTDDGELLSRGYVSELVHYLKLNYNTFMRVNAYQIVGQDEAGFTIVQSGEPKSLRQILREEQGLKI